MSGHAFHEEFGDPERDSVHEPRIVQGGVLPSLDTSFSKVSMSLDIEEEISRYREIARGAARKDLKKFMSSDDIVFQKGREKIRVPLPAIDPPEFRFSSEQRGGVGQGDGSVGDSISRDKDGNPQPGEAGEERGEHSTEEFTFEELAAMMAEELQLPRIEPKGEKSIETDSERYLSVARHGPRSLLDIKRTFKQALLREIASGNYDADNPSVTPIKDDYRYRAPRPEYTPQFNALTVFIIDVSGSMDEDKKLISRKIAFWINVWLQAHYKGVEQVFIIHDTEAERVEEEVFFTTTTGGGTHISSAYKKVEELLPIYPPQDWNYYVFQFSDGDNFSTDNAEALKTLSNLLPFVNLVGYGEILNYASWGNPFSKVLEGALKADERLAIAHVKSEDEISEAIKTFFGKGR